MGDVHSAVIVGGGIAGLASAVALQRIGVRCDVIEIGEAPVGASMSLSAGATQALDDLGLYDRCAETGNPFTAEMASPVMRGATGQPMGPPPPPRPERPGSRPAMGVYRPVFGATLERAASDAGARLRKGLSISALRDGDEGCEVELTDGTRGVYDVVIGADGINSATRRLLIPDAPEPQYAGQMSIRWMLPGRPPREEGWYVNDERSRLGYFYMPAQDMTYVPMVLTMPQQRLSQEEAVELVDRFLGTFSAPGVVELRRRLGPTSSLVCRPFAWLLVDRPWWRGRTLLIGDAAHATTAHLGMGAGMALEDAVVLGESLRDAKSVQGAWEAFMDRRFDRVRTVVETSVAVSRAEQQGAPESECARLRSTAMSVLAKAY